MRFAKLAAALLLAFCAFAGPAFAEVAVVDVARVIERSVPGKVGQQYIDNLRKSLNDELAAFAKSASKDKDAAQKTAQKPRFYSVDSIWSGPDRNHSGCGSPCERVQRRNRRS